MFDFRHCGLHGYIYGCIHGGITGGNSSTELLHFLLGLKKPDCKVLKRDSSSWLRVWAMMMGELKRERAGSEIFAEK